MPFEINEGSDTPFTEIDPDFQLYTDSNYISNVNCNYFIEDTFVYKFARPGSLDRNISMFHINENKFPKHRDEWKCI